MLHALNLYSAVCQLYLSKTEGEKPQKTKHSTPQYTHPPQFC